MRGAVPYLLSLGVGLLVGLLYALVKVRSPAPPIVALVGLFGMVIGEAGGQALRRQWSAPATSSAESVGVPNRHQKGKA